MSSYGRKMVRSQKANDSMVGKANKNGEVALGAMVEQAIDLRGMEGGNSGVVYGVFDRNGLRAFETVEEFNSWLMNTDCL